MFRFGSPAPDHIFLFRNEDDAIELINESGYQIESYSMFPMNGYTIDKAKKIQATIRLQQYAKKVN